MARASDIDTAAAVRKFLDHRSVANRGDESADTSSEMQAILETAALSFLLFPQAALSFVLSAKNVLQQILSANLSILDHMISAIGDIENPSTAITSLSDLVDAETALVEVDRLGRVGTDVKALSRYTVSIDRFLDKQLAKSLKRKQKKEFERSGAEAKQDIYFSLPVLTKAHSSMVKSLDRLAASVSDFESVDLVSIVAPKAISRVRASFRKVLSAIDKRAISKTSIAIELLSGAAALQSVSDVRKIYDPTIETGKFPVGRIVTVTAAPAKALAKGAIGAVDLSAVATPWLFQVTVDPSVVSSAGHSIELPCPGASGRAYVTAMRGPSAATFNIPADACTLYVQLEGPIPPAGEAVLVRTITLPTGPAVSLSAVRTSINSELASDATCVELYSGAGRLLIYGGPSVTKIVVRGSVPGTFNVSGVFVPAANTANTALGFRDDQASQAIGVFTPEALVDILTAQIPNATVAVVDRASQIESVRSTLQSSLLFGGVAANFGYSLETYESSPAYLALVENNVELDPQKLGVFIGSVVTTTESAAYPRKLSASVIGIDGNHLLFAPAVSLPRCHLSAVTVESPYVAAVLSLLKVCGPYVGALANDVKVIQLVINPLLARPTLAQINDAKLILVGVRSRLEILRASLAVIVVPPNKSDFSAVADKIKASLEERNMDRALELLKRGSFSEFFALTSMTVTKGGRFLSAIEAVGSNDLTVSNIDDDLQKSRPTGATPDDDILDDRDLA